MVLFKQLLASAMRHSAKLSAFAALGLTGLLAAPAKADPPPTPGIPVFCFRFTDVKEIGGAGSNDFQFEFEILNWTTSDATQLDINFASVSGNGPVNPTANGTPVLNSGVTVTQAFVDMDGRRLPPGAPQPIPGNVGNNPVGSGNTLNDWTATLVDDYLGGSDQPVLFLFGSAEQSPVISVKRASYKKGTAIPYINLMAISDGKQPQQTIAAINDLPAGPGLGYCPNQDFSPLNNIESIDNCTNVLDGFAFEVQDFEPGDYIVYDWQLLPDGFNNPGGSGLGALSRNSPVSISFFPAVSGFTSTGFSSSNLTLFAPGSPPVGSEYGMQGVLAAGPVSLLNVNDVSQGVPAPLPVLGAAAAFGSIRKLRKFTSQLHRQTIR